MIRVRMMGREFLISPIREDLGEAGEPINGGKCNGFRDPNRVTGKLLALGELNGMSMPVDMGVVLLEPVITEDHIMMVKFGNDQCNRFPMSNPNLNQDCNSMGDKSCSIMCPISVSAHERLQ